jgi:hypothetical protein
MRPSRTLALFLGAALTLATATGGCRDSTAAAPQEALDNWAGTNGDEGSAGGNGGNSDSSSTEQPPNTHTPADPAPAPDTVASPPPAPPASFTLTGVALGAESGIDTVRTVPLAGVTARIYRVQAADGSSVAESLVGTATTDANGRFAFRDLASAFYRLDVVAPAAGPYVDASRLIAPPWSTAIVVHIVLPRKG